MPDTSRVVTPPVTSTSTPTVVASGDVLTEYPKGYEPGVVVSYLPDPRFDPLIGLRTLKGEIQALLDLLNSQTGIILDHPGLLKLSGLVGDVRTELLKALDEVDEAARKNVEAVAKAEQDARDNPPDVDGQPTAKVTKGKENTVGALSESDVGTRFTWKAMEDPKSPDKPYTAVLMSLHRDANGKVDSANFRADADSRTITVSGSEPIWYVV